MNNSDANSEHASFERIGKDRLFERVAHQIEQKIMEGELRPGDQLPPERIMAEQFGVSRTVIREAVKVLEISGLVTVQRGRGMMVTKPSVTSVTDSMQRYVKIQRSSLWALLELRSILEVEIAGLAAERCTEEDIEELQEIMRTMSNKVDSPTTYVELDLEFHLALARASHNPLFQMVLEPFMSLMREARQVGASVPHAAERTHIYHQQLLKAVKDKNADEARRLMQEHLELVSQFIDERSDQ
jgi:GntR family transcriptional repressor for pyruvate dehydrogenase complex